MFSITISQLVLRPSLYYSQDYLGCQYIWGHWHLNPRFPQTATAERALRSKSVKHRQTSITRAARNFLLKNPITLLTKSVDRTPLDWQSDTLTARSSFLICSRLKIFRCVWAPGDTGHLTSHHVFLCYVNWGLFHHKQS